MIFVTVGSVTPFDRLVRCVDEWGRRNPSADVLAQIGSGTFVPQHCRHVRELPPEEYAQAFASAELVVAHAGMGTIIKAVELNKPTFLLPRLGRLQETRNDHQSATLERFESLSMISAATSEEALVRLLNDYARDPAQFVNPPPPRDSRPQRDLIEFVSSFVASE